MLKFLICLCAIFVSTANAAFACQVTPSSVGKVKLGLTLKQVKKTYPSAKLKRTSDGDGVALVEINIKNQPFAIVYADESDPKLAINLNKKIEYIETFNPNCRTKNGIKPGMLLAQAENVLGGVDEIVESEIEQRQSVTFNADENYHYRIDYCGDFADGKKMTKKYVPQCKILSIAISKHHQ